MPNQRKKDKKLVGFFADPLEYAAIQKLAKVHAVSVAELLRRIANGTIKLGLWVLGGLVGLAALGLVSAGSGGCPQAGAQAAAVAVGSHGGGASGGGPVLALRPGQKSGHETACDRGKSGVAGGSVHVNIKA